MMATQDQEDFIAEMKTKKPADIWLELWEARKKIEKLESVLAKYPFIRPEDIRPTNYVSPDGDYEPLITMDGKAPTFEIFRDGTGRIHVRPYSGIKKEVTNG
jgi:hypothetical protein